jgi:mono/diheme cytochrome c family protein
MSKSIMLLLACGVFVVSPSAIAGRQTPQAAQPATQQAAPAATPTPAIAPAQENPAAAPAGPKKADSMKNPVKPTAESQAKAKQIYSIDCSMCHGDNGNGKTDLATSMGLTLTDLSDPKTLSDRMDGELFNIIRNGKGQMPNEDAARANDELVWNLIIYVRSFSKGAAPPASTASR